MNKTLEKFARNFIKESVNELTEEQQLLFRRMYSHKNLDANWDSVVNNMPVDKLDWAMTQVENTLIENSKGK